LFHGQTNYQTSQFEGEEGNPSPSRKDVDSENIKGILRRKKSLFKILTDGREINESNERRMV